ncbi:hypothetical protein STVA_08510 [Allostella vacuolata]|nr:hypothetical protein STVA_08510 [Stella vacuolata]
MSNIMVLDMAVLPGAIVGELLDQLNIARRRVVLDGFEAHAGEWSDRWSAGGTGRRPGPGGPAGETEAEVLERVAEEMTADRPGQPTAADVVLAVTMAIRRDPEKAAVIVDAMLVDHPRMAVVIVATALRICPGLRKQILAQARHHKPFSRHPFLLGILLAFVAKVLGDHSAEAAESFVDAETPADIVAALGRHYAARGGADGGDRGAGGSRAIGAGPYLAPAFVATVLAAGEAWSREVAPEAGQQAAPQGSRVRSGALADETEEQGPADQSSRIDGDAGRDRIERAATDPTAAGQPAAGDGPAGMAPRPDGPAAAVEDAAAVAPRAMLAPGQGDGRVHSEPADEALATAADAAGPAAPAIPTLADAAAAILFERLLLKLNAHDGEALDAPTLLADLADGLAGAARAELAPSDPTPAREPDGSGPSAVSAPAAFALWADDEVPEGPSPGGATQGSTELGLDLGLDLGLEPGLAGIAGSGAFDPMPDDGAPAEAVGEFAVWMPDLVDAGVHAQVQPDGGAAAELGAAMAVPGLVEAAAVAELALLDDDALLDTSVQMSAAIPDLVAAAVAADLAIGGEEGLLATEVDASIEVPGLVEAAADVDLGLLDEDGLVDTSVQAPVALPDGTGAAVAADVGVGGGGPAVAVQAAAEIVPDVPVVASATLLDPDTGTSADVAVAVPGAAAVEIATVVELEEGPAVEASVAVDPVASLDLVVGGDAGLEFDLDLLPQAPPVPVVEEVVDVVETLAGGLFDSSPAEDDPPPAPSPPVPPVQSVLYSLGGLFS